MNFHLSVLLVVHLLDQPIYTIFSHASFNVPVLE